MSTEKYLYYSILFKIPNYKHYLLNKMNLLVNNLFTLFLNVDKNVFKQLL